MQPFGQVPAFEDGDLNLFGKSMQLTTLILLSLGQMERDDIFQALFFFLIKKN
jgi:hypothetical protein